MTLRAEWVFVSSYRHNINSERTETFCVYFGGEWTSWTDAHESELSSPPNGWLLLRNWIAVL